MREATPNISKTEGLQLFTDSLLNKNKAVLGNILSLFPGMVVEVLKSDILRGPFLSRVEDLVNSKSREILQLLFSGNTNTNLHVLAAAKKEGNECIRHLASSWCVAQLPL